MLTRLRSDQSFQPLWVLRCRSTAGWSSVAQNDGCFYVADRNSKEILRYDDIEGARQGKPVIKDWEDNAEFLMLVRR